MLSLPLRTKLFLFVNKRRDSMKAIFWDGDGFVIWYKRLERGTWQLPTADSDPLELGAHELAMILRGIDLTSAHQRIHYERPAAV
jgi:transposase